jgi:hypothetical protein
MYNLGIWAFTMLAKSRTLSWYVLVMVPFIFVLGGSIASFVIGSVIGKKKKKKGGGNHGDNNIYI